MELRLALELLLLGGEARWKLRGALEPLAGSTRKGAEGVKVKRELGRLESKTALTSALNLSLPSSSLLKLLGLRSGGPNQALLTSWGWG